MGPGPFRSLRRRRCSSGPRPGLGRLPRTECSGRGSALESRVPAWPSTLSPGSQFPTRHSKGLSGFGLVEVWPGFPRVLSGEGQAGSLISHFSAPLQDGIWFCGLGVFAAQTFLSAEDLFAHTPGFLCAGVGCAREQHPLYLGDSFLLKRWAAEVVVDPSQANRSACCPLSCSST